MCIYRQFIYGKFDCSRFLSRSHIFVYTVHFMDCRSPGGTPLRTKSQNTSVPADSDPAAIIARALQKKFSHSVFQDSPGLCCVFIIVWNCCIMLCNITKLLFSVVPSTSINGMQGKPFVYDHSSQESIVGDHYPGQQITPPCSSFFITSHSTVYAGCTFKTHCVQ